MKNEQDNVISARGLRKSFGTQVVLDGIDLNVARGKTLSVLGRSGTGKSVLLKLIIGLQKPDDGHVELNGADLNQLPLDELNKLRKKTGYLFQNAALYDSLTVGENVAFPLRRHSDMKANERDARVRELLERVGIAAAIEKMPADISGGMKKRVGLARALALDPEIMLLDEPTAGLDPITSSEINELIRELQQERQMTSIVVTHDMHSVRAIADRVMLLNEGEVVIDGTFEDLQRSDDPFVVKFMHETEGVR
jgi:phospholipid/cholesterol/gamma-HCH transport system ATP-binding protein